ncbi:methylisocitrate lyase [Aquibacillus sp. 3ASR75-11]|uniref:Methylisocitrate lyase n=1 Tax=Terrihalobacillus insolitus TaxID=2950438 RepID=A0A9X4AKN6_9BACI|nr:methylisocitrate lyase [Terrihalobacillus insolitus]MDC3423296.1 methylisocitrate lyase [Terrihalobacillus insolitus]
MSWLIQEQSTQEELASTFRTLMLDESILKLPGAHDGMAALIAKKVGFSALYLSGASYTASKGMPDLGMITTEEISSRAKDLIRATNLPLLVDIDTGYGGVLNTARTAREMVEAKVAAVQLEDQDLPKKCGHLNGKRLVTTDEMVQKIRIIKEVAPSLVVVARTDASAVEGVESAISRANDYIAAGADAIFPEALTDKAQFEQFKQKVATPLLANMTEFGKTPYYTAQEFQEFGYSMVIYPVTSLRVAAKAYERVFTEIAEKGTQKDMLADMQSRKELYDTIDYYNYESLDSKIAKTVL